MFYSVLICLIFTLLILTSPLFVRPSSACDSLVIGKDVSATGKVLVGHNEDDIGRVTVSRYVVPRRKHKPGDMINLEKNCATIPQVPQTYSYFWTETRGEGEWSFSDDFVNEWGVAIVSNRCRYSREDQGELSDGGVGYGIRRITAERAKSAVEALNIAIELVEKYGYIDSARSYTFADVNEAWILHIVEGKHYVAQRVGDDEVLFIPNQYIIGEIDLDDRERFRASPDIITYALKRGWYSPAKEGDYSDFNFTKVYQDSEGRYGNPTDYSYLRHRNNLEKLADMRFDPANDLPFAVKPDHKIGVKKIKEVLRSHYEGTPDDVTDGYRISPHFSGIHGACTWETTDAVVIEFDEIPTFTTVWATTGRPCVSPFVPWYLGIKKTPDTYGKLIDPIEAIEDHFIQPVESLGYDPDLAWSSFADMQNIVDPQYRETIEMVKAYRDALEEEWNAERPIIEKMARTLYSEDPDLARDYLTEYTGDQALKAIRYADRIYRRLDRFEIKITPDQISRSNPPETVSVTLLSSEDLDVSSIDPQSILFGPDYKEFGEWEISPSSYSFEDTNGDEKLDLVIRFNGREIVKHTTHCLTGFWLSATTDKLDKIVTRNFINIME